MPDI
jgi:hypothetical protein